MNQAVVNTVRKISTLMTENKVDLKKEINRKIYFRVSLIGACNFNCEFCHNEGAGSKGSLDISYARKIFSSAFDVGFERIQFTGGEPLLHQNIIDFVQMSRSYFNDIGITTNGSYLPEKIDDLIGAGLSRLHISLHEEAISSRESSDIRDFIKWIQAPLKKAVLNKIMVRLNITATPNTIPNIEYLFDSISEYGCDIKILRQLPKKGQGDSGVESIANKLNEIILNENRKRKELGLEGVVEIRERILPDGIRCVLCPDRVSCREGSRSLRLGADYMLRPCLATRIWDQKLDVEGDVKKQIEDAAYLATDY